MHSKIRFLLCLFPIISVVLANGGDSVSVDPGEATDEIVQSLHKLTTATDALPVILFEMKETRELYTVTGLVSAEVKDGRLVSGTEFYSRKMATQRFFCPKPDTDTSGKCLAPKVIDKSQPLQCDSEPTPIVENTLMVCGTNRTGTGLAFHYKICPAKKPYKYITGRYIIYYMCYDTSSKKILSVAYKLDGSALLGDELFIRERELTYEMNKETYGIIDTDFYANLEEEIKQKPQYKLKKLVPTEDMPLVTSRKTTEYFANFAFQHGALTDLWDEITNYFRDFAKSCKQNKFSRFTGVFDIPENEMINSVDENQMRNIWVTMMMDYSEHPTLTKVAVLMNNFIVKDPNNQDEHTESSKEQFIDKLCGKNFCVDSLKDKFNAIGVEGRCCKVTKEIYNLFSPNKNFKKYEILDVENITYVV